MIKNAFIAGILFILAPVGVVFALCGTVINVLSSLLDFIGDIIGLMGRKIIRRYIIDDKITNELKNNGEKQCH